jgi:hypothetical protein
VATTVGSGATSGHRGEEGEAAHQEDRYQQDDEVFLSRIVDVIILWLLYVDNVLLAKTFRTAPLGDS